MNNGMLSVDDALEQLLAGARTVAGTETVHRRATGRVLARPSTRHSTCHRWTTPPWTATRSAARTALGAMHDCPSRSASPQAPSGAARAGTAARIFTGAPIPPGADAVVMQERCAAEGVTMSSYAPKSGDWIRRVGEDIRRKPDSGGRHKLRPQDIGLAASVGIAVLPVFRRLKVAVFFTGDELVMPGEPLPPGAIYNSNRFTITAILRTAWLRNQDFGIVPDSLSATRDALRRAARRTTSSSPAAGYRSARRTT